MGYGAVLCILDGGKEWLNWAGGELVGRRGAGELDVRSSEEGALMETAMLPYPAVAVLGVGSLNLNPKTQILTHQ